MHSHILFFIQDLAVIMLVAGLITIFCHRFKQPVVFGYLIAGILIGPHTPPVSLISDETTIKTLAEVGVIFLMFSLGLEFNLHKLGKVGVAASVIALLEIVLMIWLGYGIGKFFHWGQLDSIFLGSLMAISSTTIIIKALDELGLKRKSFAQLIFGVLILEDIFAIVILALLSNIAVTNTLSFKEIATTLIKLSSFLVVAFIIGFLFIPRLLSYIARFKSNEMLLITVLGLCFGFCLIVVKLQYSVALGAFVMGAIIAESKQLKKIEELIMPLRDMFSAIFFVSVGMLFDPKILTEHFMPVLIITLVVVVGKIFACSVGALLSGRDGKTAMQVGTGLAQIGEFSFIIATLGLTLNVTSNFLYPIAVAVSAITTLLTPYLIQHSDALSRLLSYFIPKKVATVFEVYSSWMQSIHPSNSQKNLKESINRSIRLIIVNLFIVSAIFLGSAFLAKTAIGKMTVQMTNLPIQKMLIWGGALVLSLPPLIAVYRKIKGLSMILAELSVEHNVENRLTLSIRRLISEVIPVIAIIGIMLMIFTLSASILPPIELLCVIFIIACILLIVLRPWFIRLHSKLQISLAETLKKDDNESTSIK